MSKVKGSGTILSKGKDSHGRGVWQVQYCCGTNPDGTRKRAYRTVHGTKADAAKVLRQLQDNYEKGLQLDGGQMLFRDFAQDWHTKRVEGGKLAPTSILRERTHIETLSKHLGDIELGKLTPAAIESAYQEIRREKLAERGSYSETTLRAVHTKLKQILQKAVDYDYILRNPCERVDAPKTEKVERRSLSAKEGRTLLAKVRECEQNAYREMEAKNARVDADHAGKRKGTESLYQMRGISCIVAVRIGLATGLRRGEVLGLCWGDVPLVVQGGGVSGVVHVVRSLDTQGNLKDPKTASSRRDVAIDAETAESLQAWKVAQAGMFKRLGLKQTAQTPVVCTSTGGFMDGHNFYKWWQEWTAENGFPGLKFHELRHTQASQLLGHGADIMTVQKRLGHSKASVTLDYYGHALPGNDRVAADLIGNIFSCEDSENVVQFKAANA